MKILYLANIRLPTEKAHGIQIMKMCEAFARLGHTVELVVPTRHTPITDDAFSYYGVERNFTITRLKTVDTVKYGWWGFWLQTFFWIRKAVRYARSASVDVIYSRDVALFFFGNISDKKTLVWEVHIKPTQRVLNRIRKRVFRIVTISAGIKNVFVEGGIEKERVLVAHDGVDIAELTTTSSKDDIRNKLSLPHDKEIVAYIGKFSTMGQSKGVAQLIEAVGLLHTSRPQVFLLLVGLEECELAQVNSLVLTAGISTDSYSLVGHITHKDIAQYLKAANVLIMSYPNTEHYAHYMSPLKLFEYMASGTPIVTTDLPSIREVLDDTTARFTDDDSVPSLKTAIEETLLDIPHAREMAQEAALRVTEYTWNKRAKKIFSNFSHYE